MFVKGHTKYGGKVKGTKNYATLDKLQRRAEFDKIAAQKFIEWINAARPEYGLDQFLGKAEDKISVKVSEEPSESIKTLAKALLDAQLNNKGGTDTGK